MNLTSNSRRQVTYRISISCCLLLLVSFLSSCHINKKIEQKSDTIDENEIPVKNIIPERKIYTACDIEVERNLKYAKDSLSEEYRYKDTLRSFQLDKIKTRLALLENIRNDETSWAIIQNYKNLNGTSPLVANYSRDEYDRIVDSLGTERYQSAPLYKEPDLSKPIAYGNDGWLVRILESDSTFSKCKGVSIADTWLIPNKYLCLIKDTLAFDKAIMVDITNQNISTFEKVGSVWNIRSMEHATTGRYKPPYAQRTPTGLFIIQEKKRKMIYLEDGGTEIAGFAPFAVRFTRGGYVHGVPSVVPNEDIIEYSYSLGTTPRSHMCVRTRSSHANFIYDWSLTKKTPIFVFD